MEKVLDKIKEKHNRINKLFPKYAQCTEDIFNIVSEMISVDYSDIISDRKKLRTVNQYLKDILVKVFDDVGHKKYIKEVLGVFIDSEVSRYLTVLLKSEGERFAEMVNCVKYELIYWQSSDDTAELKLETILSKIDN